MKIPPFLPPSPCTLTRIMHEFSCSSVNEFHAFSCKNPELFWNFVINTCGIRFKKNPSAIVEQPLNIKHPNWLPDAEWNIVDSCFKADLNRIAIIDTDSTHQLRYTTYEQLLTLTNRISNTIHALGYKAGDPICVCMPMHMEAVAIYLAIIQCGAYVVSIADSFSPNEIEERLNITQTKLIFTQDVTFWGEKKLPLSEKFDSSRSVIVLAHHNKTFSEPLSSNITFSSYPAHAKTICNVLFSSGTTGTPKAIPWTHTTPIKVASDALLHHDLSKNDVLCWPSNIGWMMGPWAIFASFIHEGTLALFPKGARENDFGSFVEKANVTVLGVVPSLVAHWKNTRCMESFNWKKIRLFTSTGECSTPEDMLYLSNLAGKKPIIEYCGGTEIGGAYITSTLAEPNYLSAFTTPAFGVNVVILNEKNELDVRGEAAIVPPSIGLSDSLLNADHDEVYYKNMPQFPEFPVLRRHGDAIVKTEDVYVLEGRMDDTMNLGGIKVSSAEIERVLKFHPAVEEIAAVSVHHAEDRREQLVVFVTGSLSIPKEKFKNELQSLLNQQLNPLYKIHDVVVMNELPKTASNKIMRRVLRKQYGK